MEQNEKGVFGTTSNQKSLSELLLLIFILRSPLFPF